MKRFAIAAAILVALVAGAFTAVQKSRMKHPHSGIEITVPGRDGAGVLTAHVTTFVEPADSGS